MARQKEEPLVKLEAVVVWRGEDREGNIVCLEGRSKQQPTAQLLCYDAVVAHEGTLSQWRDEFFEVSSHELGIYATGNTRAAALRNFARLLYDYKQKRYQKEGTSNLSLIELASIEEILAMIDVAVANKETNKIRMLLQEVTRKEQRAMREEDWGFTEKIPDSYRNLARSLGIYDGFTKLVQKHGLGPFWGMYYGYGDEADELDSSASLVANVAPDGADKSGEEPPPQPAAPLFEMAKDSLGEPGEDEPGDEIIQPTPINCLKVGQTESAPLQNRTTLTFDLAIVEIKDILPATGLDQMRNRGRWASNYQITEMAKNLIPDKLLNPTRNELYDGTPIITAAGNCNSGNGRTMALLAAYTQSQQYPGSGAAYKAALVEMYPQAADFEYPVLVRMLRSSDIPLGYYKGKSYIASAQEIEISREANCSPLLSLSPAELAKKDAAILREHNVFFNFSQGRGPDHEDNKIAYGVFKRCLTPNELNALVNANGTAGRQLIERIKNACLYQVFQGESADKLFCCFAEDTETGIRNLEKAIQESLALFLRVIELFQTNNLPKEYDLFTLITDTTVQYRDYKRLGVNISILNGQGSLLEEENPAQAALLQFFDKNMTKSKKLRVFFLHYCDFCIKNQTDLNTASMFDLPTYPTPLELVEKFIALTNADEESGYKLWDEAGLT